MSTSNTVICDLVCPRCGAAGEFRVRVHFGDTSLQREFRLGDVYPWREGKQERKGGRPPGGDRRDYGYTVCSACGKDVHVRVTVRGDRVADVGDAGPGYAP